MNLNGAHHQANKLKNLLHREACRAQSRPHVNRHPTKLLTKIAHFWWISSSLDVALLLCQTPTCGKETRPFLGKIDITGSHATFFRDFGTLCLSRWIMTFWLGLGVLFRGHRTRNKFRYSMQNPALCINVLVKFITQTKDLINFMHQIWIGSLSCTIIYWIISSKMYYFIKFEKKILPQLHIWANTFPTDWQLTRRHTSNNRNASQKSRKARF